MSRRGTAGLLAACLVLAALLSTSAAAGAAGAAAPQSPEPVGWIVVDAGTGEVLAAKAPHVPSNTASLAKIMTALTAVERLPADSTITASELAAAQPATRFGLEAGDTISLIDAVAAILVESANDVAYAVAEASGGDLDTFAEQLNATAARYGMQDTTLGDPAGLDADGEVHGAAPMMSPFDIAIAARNALAVPTLAALAASPTYDYTNRNDVPSQMENHNKMLPGGDDGRDYAGANGLKTGFTSRAGHTLAATATRDGRTIIVIILNTYDTYGWASYLLDVGFGTAAGHGTGERLPKIAVDPYSQRQTDLTGFAALTGGTEEIAALSATTVATAAASGVAPTDGPTTVPTTVAPATEGGAAGGTDAAALAATDTSAGDGSSGVPRPVLLLALLVAVAAGLLLRRRQIMIRKRRRMRARATQRAMRRGTLPVADGRVYTQMRTGSPRLDATTDSHVRRIPRDRNGNGASGNGGSSQHRGASSAAARTRR